MSDEWKDNYTQFLSDMGRANINTTLGRIDNDGNYCVSNCEWQDYKTQMRNTSRNKYIEHNGTKMCLKGWSERLNINYKYFHKLITKGKTIKEIEVIYGRV